MVKHNCQFGVLRFGDLLSLILTEDFLPVLAGGSLSLFSFQSGFVHRDEEVIRRTPSIGSPCKVPSKSVQFNTAFWFWLQPHARHRMWNKRKSLTSVNSQASLGNRLSALHSADISWVLVMCQVLLLGAGVRAVNTTKSLFSMSSDSSGGRQAVNRQIWNIL